MSFTRRTLDPDLAPLIGTRDENRERKLSKNNHFYAPITVMDRPRPSSSSSTSFKGLPALPPSSSINTTANEFGEQLQPRLSTSQRVAATTSNVTKRLSNTVGRLSMQSKRGSTTGMPRPEPIPVPEPVVIPANMGNIQQPAESSGEGPSSSSSTGSALASVSADLVHPNNGLQSGGHSHSNSLSPSSPKETNQLLEQQQQQGARTRVLPTTPTNRPYSAVDSTTQRPPPSSYDSNGSRPYSSADAYAIASLITDNSAQPTPASRSPSSDSLLRPGQMPRSRSTNFLVNTPSPLNPNSTPTPSNAALPPLAPPRRPGTSSSSRPGSAASRPGSMVLYRLAGIGDDFNPQMSSLSPPVTTNSRRASRFSTLSSSSYSVFGDSKYPMPAREDGSLTPPPSGAFLPYEYDPTSDQDAPDDAEDVLHRPDEPGTKPVRMGGFNVRGVCNIFVMVAILSILIGIFVLYPVVSHYDHAAQAALFSGTDSNNNPSNNGGATNSTYSRTKDVLIDPDTPSSAKSWTGIDQTTYELVFSDEFKMEGRSFGSNDDPFWQAVSLHDAKNNDLNYMDPGQVTTKGGALQITLEKKSSNGQNYVSGMVQTWNNFCFQAGYIEVSVSLPGSSSNAGFNAQAYTMGNLARSGYQASESGVWPYSYDTCDGGTTNVTPNQRLSACVCPNAQGTGDHPGPLLGTGSVRGRGAPQIDILGYFDENADTDVISQSYHVAPASGNQPARGITESQTTLNPWQGTTTQQVISGLYTVDQGSYQGGGGSFTSFGYQHIANTDTPTQAALHWVQGGSTETFRITGQALAADGNVDQRLVTNEPMYIVLSLALSQIAGNVDTSSLTFPATFLVDYVRVYQIKGQNTKVSCDPTDYPTQDYITKFNTAYTDNTKTTFTGAGYTEPTNNQTGTC